MNRCGIVEIIFSQSHSCHVLEIPSKANKQVDDGQSTPSGACQASTVSPCFYCCEKISRIFFVHLFILFYFILLFGQFRFFLSFLLLFCYFYVFYFIVLLRAMSVAIYGWDMDGYQASQLVKLTYVHTVTLQLLIRFNDLTG